MPLRTFSDKPITDMMDEINKWIEKGAEVYMKWTCPGCGERVASETANVHHTRGYRHGEKANGEFCGELYTGALFGYMLVLGAVLGGTDE
jgi:hypothetical protein